VILKQEEVAHKNSGKYKIMMEYDRTLVTTTLDNDSYFQQTNIPIL